MHCAAPEYLQFANFPVVNSMLPLGADHFMMAGHGAGQGWPMPPNMMKSSAQACYAAFDSDFLRPLNARSASGPSGVSSCPHVFPEHSWAFLVPRAGGCRPPEGEREAAGEAGLQKQGETERQRQRRRR